MSSNLKIQRLTIRRLQLFEDYGHSIYNISSKALNTVMSTKFSIKMCWKVGKLVGRQYKIDWLGCYLSLVSSLVLFYGSAATRFQQLIDIAVVEIGKPFRFKIHYVLWSLSYGISNIALLQVDNGGLWNSASVLFRSAVWAEREVWDMFGIRPVFNSSLNKILTDYSFIGHPLRRDFFSPLVFDVDFTEWGELSKVGRLFKKQIYEVGL